MDTLTNFARTSFQSLIATFQTLPTFLEGSIRVKQLKLFVVWIFFLSLVTLSVQHSCNPMIGDPSPQCMVASTSHSTSSSYTRGKSIQSPNRQQGYSRAKSNSGEMPANVMGVVGGTAVAVGGVVIGAPVEIGVAAGVIVWLAVKSLSSLL